MPEDGSTEEAPAACRQNRIGHPDDVWAEPMNRQRGRSPVAPSTIRRYLHALPCLFVMRSPRGDFEGPRGSGADRGRPSEIPERPSTDGGGEMLGEKADLIRQGIELFNKANIPELMELYDDSVEVESQGSIIGGELRGEEGLGGGG